MATATSNEPLCLSDPTGPQMLYGAADPDAGAGVPAPLASIYAQTTTGTLWRKTGAADTDWSQLGAGNPTNGWYGTGEDGSHTVVGTETLVNDMQYTELTVPNGAVLQTAGWRIYATVSVTVEAGGTIRNNGTSATATGGAGGATGNALPGGSNAGGGLTGAGANGSSAGNQPLGMPAGTGNGGAGGSALNAGGAGGTTTFAAAPGNPCFWAFLGIRYRMGMTTGAGGGGTAPVSSGCGGGGGGGSGAGNSGGGGGGGAGTIAIIAPLITNNGAIEARGGNGAPGQSGNSGGGGGGGGGRVVIVGDLVGTAPDVSGGTGGAGLGTGTAGTNGNAGYVISIAP